MRAAVARSDARRAVRYRSCGAIPGASAAPRGWSGPFIGPRRRPQRDARRHQQQAAQHHERRRHTGEPRHQPRGGRCGDLAEAVAGQPQGEGGGAGAVGGGLDHRRHGQRLSDAQAETEQGEHHRQRPHRDRQRDARAEEGRQQTRHREEQGAPQQP